MTHVSLQYTDGKLNEMTMFDPLDIGVIDCRERESGPPFITVGFGDGQMNAEAYLSLELARKLYDMLGPLVTNGDSRGKEIKRAVPTPA